MAYISYKKIGIYEIPIIFKHDITDLIARKPKHFTVKNVNEDWHFGMFFDKTRPSIKF